MIKPSFVWLWEALMERENREVFTAVAEQPGKLVSKDNSFWGKRCGMFEHRGFMTSVLVYTSASGSEVRAYSLTTAAMEVLE